MQFELSHNICFHKNLLIFVPSKNSSFRTPCLLHFNSTVANLSDSFVQDYLPFIPHLMELSIVRRWPFPSIRRFLPFSSFWRAMCVIVVFGVAPCQCLTPGAVQTTSPSLISSIFPSHCWTQPELDLTIKVCPGGWECHAVQAPGSNVTWAPDRGATKTGHFKTIKNNCLLLTLHWIVRVSIL